MKVPRNALCPCGSGRKYKHCCMGRPEPGPGPDLRPAAARARRGCDGCTACCGPALTLNEPGLVAPRGESCPHRRNNGCDIYGPAMPATCRNYVCDYLRHPGPITAADRPDRVGALVCRTRDSQAPPPHTHSLYINECAGGGVERVLHSAVWGPRIRAALCAGMPLRISWLDDVSTREAVHICWRARRLRGALTACTAEGQPLFTTLQPVHERPIQVAQCIPELGFPFDLPALTTHLGGRARIVVGVTHPGAAPQTRNFLFTRRQAELVEQLHGWIEAEGACAASAVGKEH